MNGKVAIITGGARGLGYDMALALAEVGANLIITSRKMQSAEDSARVIRRDTGRTVTVLNLMLLRRKK
ncbi:MAG: SDR family NAD(P)-dependent oxidoreductase [Candidatus Humimicrobiaceae bacterium]